MKTVRISLTEEDVITLAHIMDHFLDYMFLDDRTDHGLGILKGYRDMDIDNKSRVSMAGCKLIRYSRKIRGKRAKEWREKCEKENENEN